MTVSAVNDAASRLRDVTLRDYQREAIDAAREKLRTERSTLVVLPTGAGKTVVFAEIVRAVVEKGGRALVLAHRSELLDQATAKIRAAAPELVVEREQADQRARLAPVVVASVQTLHRAKRLERWDPKAFALVIVDEAHHAAATSYQKILDHFASAKVLGFTATPERSDGTGLRSTFASIAYSRSMLDLVRAGHLVPIRGRVVRPEGFDVSGVKVVAGDFQEKGLTEALMEDPHVLPTIARSLVADSEGRSTLVFVPAVVVAHSLASIINAQEDAGGAVAIDGETPADERAIRLSQFMHGSKRFLVNVGVCTEGTDLPRCACVAVVRPTMSRSLFVQMVGRGTRLFDNKVDCLVLNYAPSNCRHKIVVPVDALLGEELDDLTKQAIRELAERDPDAAIDDLFAKAEELVAERKAAAARVTSIRSQLKAWDPYLGDCLDIDEPTPGRDVSEEERDRCANELIEAGVLSKIVAKLSPVQIVAMARSLRNRRRAGLCSLKQARQLAKRGLNPNATREAAGRAMQALNAAGWVRTPPHLFSDPDLRMPGATDFGEQVPSAVRETGSGQMAGVVPSGGNKRDASSSDFGEAAAE